VIAPTIVRPAVGLADDRSHVDCFEVGHRLLLHPLRRKRQHPRIAKSVVQVIAQKVLEKATQGGAPAIASGGGVGSFAFKMVEETRNRIGVQIFQHEIGYLPASVLGDELE